MAIHGTVYQLMATHNSWQLMVTMAKNTATNGNLWQLMAILNTWYLMGNSSQLWQLMVTHGNS
jgi:hypothetical protein